MAFNDQKGVDLNETGGSGGEPALSMAERADNRSREMVDLAAKNTREWRAKLFGRKISMTMTSSIRKTYKLADLPPIRRWNLDGRQSVDNFTADYHPDRIYIKLNSDGVVVDVYFG